MTNPRTFFFNFSSERTSNAPLLSASFSTFLGIFSLTFLRNQAKETVFWVKSNSTNRQANSSIKPNRIESSWDNLRLISVRFSNGQGLSFFFCFPSLSFFYTRYLLCVICFPSPISRSFVLKPIMYNKYLFCTVCTSLASVKHFTATFSFFCNSGSQSSKE